MNNDLIIREALKETMQNREECKECTDIDCISCFYEIIDNAPTVEPFERIGAICNENCGINRPHGEWLHPYKVDIACECSNCRMQMPITSYFNFCPNCGAEMRKAMQNE